MVDRIAIKMPEGFTREDLELINQYLVSIGCEKVDFTHWVLKATYIFIDEHGTVNYIETPLKGFDSITDMCRFKHNINVTQEFNLYDLNKPKTLYELLYSEESCPK